MARRLINICELRGTRHVARMTLTQLLPSVAFGLTKLIFVLVLPAKTIWHREKI